MILLNAIKTDRFFIRKFSFDQLTAVESDHSFSPNLLRPLNPNGFFKDVFT
jgi:hypothetical protein